MKLEVTYSTPTFPVVVRSITVPLADNGDGTVTVKASFEFIQDLVSLLNDSEGVRAVIV
jgi:hypothetical protein